MNGIVNVAYIGDHSWQVVVDQRDEFKLTNVRKDTGLDIEIQIGWPTFRRHVDLSIGDVPIITHEELEPHWEDRDDLDRVFSRWNPSGGLAGDQIFMPRERWMCVFAQCKDGDKWRVCRGRESAWKAGSFMAASFHWREPEVWCDLLCHRRNQ